MNDPVRRMLAVSIAIASEAIRERREEDDEADRDPSRGTDVNTTPASDAASSESLPSRRRSCGPLRPCLSARSQIPGTGAPRHGRFGLYIEARVAGEEIASRARIPALATSYAINELGDNLGMIALAILVLDRTDSALAVTALFVAGKFVPAFVAPALTAGLDHAPVSRVLPALYVLEAGAFVGPSRRSSDAFWLPRSWPSRLPMG